MVDGGGKRVLPRRLIVDVVELAFFMGSSANNVGGDGKHEDPLFFLLSTVIANVVGGGISRLGYRFPSRDR